MTTLTIRLSEEDKELFKSVSKDKNMVLSDWARETLLASIEEEYDKELIEEYLLFYLVRRVSESGIHSSGSISLHGNF